MAYPAPASTPRPSGSAWGRRAAASSPTNGMTGIRSGSTLREASAASPRARPPSAAAAVPGDSHPGQLSHPGYLGRQAGPERTVSESATRHSPPSSSSCARGSAKADRLVYCSGRVTARTTAAGGAHCGPASRPARPPKVSTARAPSTGLTSAAVVMPWIHQPPAATIACPGGNWGARPPCVTARPVLANVSPGCAPPKSCSDSGMGSEPCPAIQYPTWKSAPGWRDTMTCGELSRICQAPKPAATAIVPARPHQPVQAAAARPGRAAPGAVMSRCPGTRRPTAATRITARGAAISTSGAGRSRPAISRAVPGISQAMASSTGRTVIWLKHHQAQGTRRPSLTVVAGSRLSAAGPA